MTDGALRGRWDAGTLGTLSPPHVCVRRRRRMTPQVRPMRPARPMSYFYEIKQKNRWDAPMVRLGTARLAEKGLSQ